MKILSLSVLASFAKGKAGNMYPWFLLVNCTIKARKLQKHFFLFTFPPKKTEITFSPDFYPKGLNQSNKIKMYYDIANTP